MRALRELSLIDGSYTLSMTSEMWLNLVCGSCVDTRTVVGLIRSNADRVAHDRYICMYEKDS